MRIHALKRWRQMVHVLEKREEMMRPSHRVLIVGFLCVGLLCGIWLWLLDGLASGDMQVAGRADAAAMIGQTLGGWMGVLTALTVVAVISSRARGR
jgi:hypothetical protein